MSSESLPKGITQQAKIWTAYIAKNVKPQPAENSELLFLTGRTLLDKKTFNKLNTEEDDVVHGVQVFYGPFASKTAAQEFVSEYSGEWPDEWRFIRPGQPEILSSYYEPGHADIVHNASLEFQGQILMNQQAKKIQEIEEVQKRVKSRESEESIEKKAFTTQEKEVHITWIKNQIEHSEKNLNQMKKHLTFLENLPVKDEEQK